MTPEQKRIAIAEACGWTPSAKQTSFGKESGWRLSDGLFSRTLPDYLNDLNAMHEAEKVLVLGQRTRYCFELRKLVVMQATVEMLDPDTDRLTDLAFYSATASQRADAFLHTIGKL